ncbi:MAG: hypothetical protein N3G18_02555 [Candidatus Saccharicenans sp.]|nr:hypothetical protein [Candidatus Saccharicenans sp.]
MKRRARLELSIIVIFCLFLFSGPSQAEVGPGGILKIQNEADELDGVLRIINFLEEAASFSQEKGRFQGLVAEFTQEQVSAFFKHLLSEDNPALKSLRLKLAPGNRVEGWLVLDLSSQGISGQRNLYFSARVEQAGRRVRLNFSSLFLETQRIQPEIVNALIDLLARARNLEARHLDDWYELPEGIARVETGAGSLLVYY